MSKKKVRTTIAETKINLVPKDPFFNSFIGKTTTWALSIGRYIVIFTELVVIVSFLSRFQLDRQVTDLNNEILINSERVKSYGDLEERVREVQKKIETFNQTKTKEPLTLTLDKLSNITPAEVIFEELIIQQNVVRIEARATSRLALEEFIQNMQASGDFSEVVSDNISNTDSKTPGFDFSIQAVVGQPTPTRTPRREVEPNNQQEE